MAKLPILAPTVPPEADLFVETDKHGSVCIDLKIADKVHALAFIGADGTLELLSIPEEDQRNVRQFVRLDDKGYWKSVTE